MIKTDAKTILADSIKELLKERSFLNIGVQDIVKNCDVSRTAFYNHLKISMIWLVGYIGEMLKTYTGN